MADHLFFSPHPDDVVLSCGGMIYQMAQAGESIRVFTAMSGPIPPEVRGRPFVRELTERWKLGSDPVAGRKAEDLRAVQMLGGTVHFGDLPDAPYRTDAQGNLLYFDRDTLFGGISPRDPVLSRLDEITRQCDPQAILYVPLGVGNHVDHVIVRQALLDWWSAHPGVAVFFYEEYPYSAAGIEVIQAARTRSGRSTAPVIKSLDENALEAKIRAAACYASQISSFWDGLPTMAEAIRQYAMQVGERSYAERLWKPLPLT